VRIEARNAELAGELLLPAPAPGRRAPGIVLVHGAGRLQRHAYRAGAERLRALGFAVLLYDKRGVGESTGRYQDVSPDNSEEVLALLADDARRAVHRLAAHPGVDANRVGLFGGSQAGWILPLAATDTAVRFLIVLSGPAVSVGLEIRHGRVTDEGRRAISDREVSRDLAAFRGRRGYEPLPTLEQLRVPTLWIMGERDRNLPLAETLAVLESLPARRAGLLTLVRMPGADHQLYLPDGTRADYWSPMADWLHAQAVLPTPR
jgi:dipeptidyl aminopeptidase/acylaminoacyl peptidase